MRQVGFAIVVLLALTACAVNPVPQGYNGPLANIADSVQQRDSATSDFFVLSKIDGKKMHESLANTRSANYGSGFYMKPFMIDRNVPAAPATFTITGRTHHAAPIVAMLSKVYQVSGDVTFTPEANARYVVKGVLGDDYSAVWIEDARTGSVVERKIEVHGKASLGLFEK